MRRYDERSVSTLLDELVQESYNLEVIGEAVSVEAREIRHRAGKVSRESDYDELTATEAALSKLRDVEQEIRHQVEVMRDLGRSI